MKRIFSIVPLIIIALISSCGEDSCKPCASTTYVVIDGEQFYTGESVKAEYCGEELQELMDTEYTVETVQQEDPDITFVYTTFISCY